MELERVLGARGMWVTSAASAGHSPWGEYSRVASATAVCTPPAAEPAWLTCPDSLRGGVRVRTWTQVFCAFSSTGSTAFRPLFCEVDNSSRWDNTDSI